MKKFNPSREQILNGIGICLLAVCYILSLSRVFSIHEQETKKGTITIRIAHWQLERGVRDAIDKLAQEYMRLHPDVRIEQLAVPERVYFNWTTTQLIGGTAPDLIEIYNNLGDEKFARYFRPLSEVLDRPNPYNAGTPLEGKPWRETFIDGLLNKPTYNPSLLDFYGVTLGMNTIRVYYNKDLYEAAMGADAPPPRSYAEFSEACGKIEELGRRRGTPLVAVAGSANNGPLLMNQLFAGVTQKFGRTLDSTLVMSSTPMEQFGVDVSLGYLDGKWSLESPAVVRGLEIVHDVSRRMQPGFMQLNRDDAAFTFVQQRAVMLTTGSWDITSLLFQTQGVFRLGIARLPLPGVDDPVYGPYVLGPFSEAGSGTSTPFGLTRQSEHPEAAIDFLQFMTSHAGDKVFSDVSKWLPAVEQVAPPEAVKEFAPVLEGYPQGFNIGVGADTQRIYGNNFYLLTGDLDPVGAFTKAVEGSYRAGLVHDLQRSHLSRMRTIQRVDATYGALLHVGASPAAPADVRRKLAELGEQQNETEIINYQIARGLARAGAAPNP